MDLKFQGQSMDLKFQGQEKEENGKHLKTSTLKNGKKATATQIRGGNEESSLFPK